MRIILALHQFLPEYRAGTEVLAHQVACGLRRIGHEVMIFTGHPTVGHLSDEARFQWSEYDAFPILSFFHEHCSMAGQTDLVRQEFDSEIVRRRFGQLLRDWRPDCVHFFNFARISTSAADCCVEAEIPFFYTATDFWSVCLTARLQLEDGRSCPGPSGTGANCLAHVLEIKKSRAIGLAPLLPAALSAIQWAGRFLPLKVPAIRMLDSIGARLTVIRDRLAVAECIWVPTKTMAEVLSRHGISSEKLKKLPYGVDFARVTHRLRRRGPTLRVAFIGTVSFHKGLHNLVRAFQLMSQQDVELRIYGDVTAFPDYYCGFSERIVNDARIQLMGSFLPDHIDRVFDEIDVLVVPSLWKENAPLVVTESLARGCPVVASRQPGLTELVEHEVNGLVFDGDSPEALATALERLAREKGLLENLSSNCGAPLSLDAYVAEISLAYEAAWKH